MTTTIFVPQVTPVTSVWLNDVNNTVYIALGNGGIAPTTAAQVVANLGLPTAANAASTANPLSQFAATTSAQLLATVSDETGTGALVFANSPTLVTPALGTPSSGVATNLTGTAAALNIGGTVKGNTLTTGSSTYTGTAAQTYTFPTTTATVARIDAPNTFVGNQIFSGLTLETSKTITSTNTLTTYTASTKYNYLTGTTGASFAITLPAASAAIDGEIIVIMSTASRATTTWISSGATFVGAPSSLSVNTPVKLQYDQATTIWYITA